jgi:signal transduction histidine kinase
MMRLLPSGLTGRVTLILTLGLLAAQGIALWLLVHDRIVTSMRVFGLSFADQVGTLVEVIDGLPPADRPSLIQALNSPFLQVGVAEAVPRPQQQAWHAEEIRQMVEPHLRSQFNLLTQVLVLEPGANPPTGSPIYSELATAFPHRPTLVIAVQQVNQSWLVFAAPFEAPSLRQSWQFWVGLMALGLGVWLLSIWAARRVTQPIMQFAAAADQFGRDIHAPPLPETGSRELRQSIRAFNQMQARLRQLVKDRTFMLAALSHDLRTVLTRLKLRAEFIEDRGQAQKAIADIDQMQAMLAETLAFAREESASEAALKVDLAELLKSLCDDLADAGYLATYSGLDRFTYVGQPTALRRAFMNLMHNAVTYGQGAEVNLRLGMAVEVTICDRGPGIPPDLQQTVFAPFYRLEPSRSRETGGTGLGLTVAKTVIERHGGEIILTNRPEGGLRVQARLPLTQ